MRVLLQGIYSGVAKAIGDFVSNLKEACSQVF